MGTRMEKYKNKKKYKNRKKLRTISVMLLIAALILELSILDNVLRDMTDTQDKSMYSFNIQGDMYSIQLLGKQYYVEKSSVENILYNIKNTYYSIVDYKDKILNK